MRGSLIFILVCYMDRCNVNKKKWNIVNKTPLPPLEPFSEIDEKIINYKAARSLINPLEIGRIEQIIHNVRYVAYSKMPFFKEMNILIGSDPVVDDIEVYVEKRKSFFKSLGKSKIPLDHIVATQQVINRLKVEAKVAGAADDEGEGKPIMTVCYKGETYIIDGHHRICAASIKGDGTIEGYMLSYTLNLEEMKVEKNKSDKKRKKDKFY